VSGTALLALTMLAGAGAGAGQAQERGLASIATCEVYHTIGPATAGDQPVGFLQASDSGRTLYLRYADPALNDLYLETEANLVENPALAPKECKGVGTSNDFVIKLQDGNPSQDRLKDVQVLIKGGTCRGLFALHPTSRCGKLLDGILLKQDAPQMIQLADRVPQSIKALDPDTVKHAAPGVVGEHKLPTRGLDSLVNGFLNGIDTLTNRAL
jgi:hypothetical protein